MPTYGDYEFSFDLNVKVPVSIVNDLLLLSVSFENPIEPKALDYLQRLGRAFADGVNAHFLHKVFSDEQILFLDSFKVGNNQAKYCYKVDNLDFPVLQIWLAMIVQCNVFDTIVEVEIVGSSGAVDAVKLLEGYDFEIPFVGVEEIPFDLDYLEEKQEEDDRFLDISFQQDLTEAESENIIRTIAIWKNFVYFGAFETTEFELNTGVESCKPMVAQVSPTRIAGNILGFMTEEFAFNALINYFVYLHMEKKAAIEQMQIM